MKRNMMIKRIAVVSMAVIMMTSISGYAATDKASEPSEVGKSAAELNGYTEEEWAKLMDNTLEYDEIQDLVHNFNPVISSAWNSFDSSISSVSSMVDGIATSEREMKLKKESAISQGDYTGIVNYTMQEIILNKTKKAMRDSLDILSRPVTSANRPLRVAEAQMTSGVKSLMIGYDSVVAQKSMLTELVQLYQASYDATVASMGQGLATQADVTKALVDLQSAQSNLASLDATQENLRKTLIVMCGWNESDNPVIGSIPTADLSRIDRMNPATDITAAIGNNYSLIEIRHTKYEKSLGSKDAHLLTEEQGEATLRVNLDAAYQTVLSDKTAYQAAQAGYQAAQISKAAADTQYSLGMLSKAQYIGSTITYYQKKAAYEAADMTLTQSMDAYDDAVAGNCAIE